MKITRMAAAEAIEEYRSSLGDLTCNSKPLINMLTMLAEDHEQDFANEIVQVIEAHIQKAKSTEKLPVLYLIDSVIKNLPDSKYIPAFASNIVSTFCGVFEKVDEKTRQSMFKLRQTWSEIFPARKLYMIDVRVNQIDPAWPITAPSHGPGSIHINPKFIKQTSEEVEVEQMEKEDEEAKMRQQLIAKQQELLKLQQERLELELAETRAKLERQKQAAAAKSSLPEGLVTGSAPFTPEPKVGLAAEISILTETLPPLQLQPVPQELQPQPLPQQPQPVPQQLKPVPHQLQPVPQQLQPVPQQLQPVPQQLVDRPKAARDPRVSRDPRKGSRDPRMLGPPSTIRSKQSSAPVPARINTPKVKEHIVPKSPSKSRSAGTISSGASSSVIASSKSQTAMSEVPSKKVLAKAEHSSVASVSKSKAIKAEKDSPAKSENSPKTKDVSSPRKSSPRDNRKNEEKTSKNEGGKSRITDESKTRKFDDTRRTGKHEESKTGKTDDSKTGTNENSKTEKSDAAKVRNQGDKDRHNKIRENDVKSGPADRRSRSSSEDSSTSSRRDRASRTEDGPDGRRDRFQRRQPVYRKRRSGESSDEDESRNFRGWRGPPDKRERLDVYDHHGRSRSPRSRSPDRHGIGKRTRDISSKERDNKRDETKEKNQPMKVEMRSEKKNDPPSEKTRRNDKQDVIRTDKKQPDKRDETRKKEDKRVDPKDGKEKQEKSERSATRVEDSKREIDKKDHSRNREKDQDELSSGGHMEGKKDETPKGFRIPRKRETDNKENQEEELETADESPIKKLRVIIDKNRAVEVKAIDDDISDLFGSEDQDHRQLPQTPSAKQGPRGLPLSSPSSIRWAKYKSEHPQDFPFRDIDERVPPISPGDVDMRSLMASRGMMSPPLNSLGYPPMSRPPMPPPFPKRIPGLDRRLSIDPDTKIPKELSMHSKAEILEKAETLRHAGGMSHEQHQELLAMLGELYNFQRERAHQRQHSRSTSREDEVLPGQREPRYHQLENRLGEEGMHVKAEGVDNLPGKNVSPSKDVDLRVGGPNQTPPRLMDMDISPSHPHDKGFPRSHPPMDIDLRQEPGHPSRDVDLRSAHAQRDQSVHDIHDRFVSPIGRPPHLRVDRASSKKGQRGQRYRDEPLSHPHDLGPTQDMGPLRMRHNIPGLRGEGMPDHTRDLGKFGSSNDRPPFDHDQRRSDERQQVILPHEDLRWAMDPGMLGFDDHQEVVINKSPFTIEIGGKPRKVRLGGKGDHEVYAHPKLRGILVDGELVYRFGEPVTDVKVGSRWHKLFYHGPSRLFWINGEPYEIRIDAPPKRVNIDGKDFFVQIDGRDMMILIDRLETGPYGGSPRELSLDGRTFEIRFDPPPRKILLDGDQCELVLNRKIPVIMIRGKPHVIAFDGPPRNVLIDGKNYLVPCESPVRIRLGNRAHVLALGGPAHEVIIDGKWFEVKFGGPPRKIQLGNHIYAFSLEGPPPEVKILGEVPINYEAPVLTDKQRKNKPHFRIPSAIVTPANRSSPGPTGPGGPHLPDSGPGLGPGPGPHDRQSSGMMSRQPDEIMPQQLDGGMTQQPAGMMQRPGGGMMPQQSGGRMMPQQSGGGLMPQQPGGLIPGLNMPQIPQLRPDIPAQQQMPMRPSGPGVAGMAPINPQMMGGMPVVGLQGMAPNPVQMNLPQISPAVFANVSQSLNMLSQMTPGLQQVSPVNQQMIPNPGLPLMSIVGQPGLANPNFPVMSTSGMAQPMQSYSIQTSQRLPITTASSFGVAGQGTQTTGGLSSVLSSLFPSAAPQPTASPAPFDVSSLFQKLVSSGIINKVEQKSEEKTEEKEEKEEKMEFPEEKIEDVPDISSFNLAKLKKRYNGVIQRIYTGIQCSSCGMRFIMEDTERYREHLDWHFRQNKREKEGIRVVKNRKWYYSVNDWIQYEEIEESEERARSSIFERMQQSATHEPLFHMPAGEEIIRCPPASGNENDVCEICGEPFEQYFDEDEEAWHLRDAVRAADKTYHPVCYEDATQGGSIDAGPSPTDAPMVNPVNFIVPKTEESAEPAEPANPANQEDVAIKTESEGVTEIKESEGMNPETVVSVQTEPGSETVEETEPGIAAVQESINTAVKEEPMETSATGDGGSTETGPVS